MKFLPYLFVLTLSCAVSAQGLFSSGPEEKSSALGSLTSKQPNYSREMVLGNILKGALENLHLANKTVNDDLSKEAFKLYLERVDYGKQFLTEADVRALSAYADKMDDELVSGRLTILEATHS